MKCTNPPENGKKLCDGSFKRGDVLAENQAGF